MKILTVKYRDVPLLVELDDDDWLRLSGYKWRIKHAPGNLPQLYVKTTKRIDGKHKTIYLHRAIVAPPHGLDLRTEQEVHHRDGNTLNCQKSNLEVRDKVDHGKESASKRWRKKKVS